MSSSRLPKTFFFSYVSALALLPFCAPPLFFWKLKWCCVLLCFLHDMMLAAGGGGDVAGMIRTFLLMAAYFA